MITLAHVRPPLLTFKRFFRRIAPAYVVGKLVVD
jgi:hypothetical protein